ncbi:MAG: amidohydrolase [Planctomycetales bacterium]
MAGALSALLALACSATLLSAAEPPRVDPGNEPADLVLRNGVIATCDAENRQVAALAISGGRIAAVGSQDEIGRWIGPRTRVIDLAGKLAVPGFIEGHGHFLMLGETRRQLDLTSAKNWGEIVEQVRAAAAKAQPGDWVVGRGWHQEKWDRPKSEAATYPTHDELSRASPDNPVLLVHASGHMSIANAAALRAAEVNRDTEPPPGGEILRNDAGEPTGVLRETAQGLVRAAYDRRRARRPAELSDDEKFATVSAATRECLVHGVTSFQDAGSSFGDIQLFRRLADADSLKVRMWVMVRGEPEALRRNLASVRMIDRGNGFLTVRAIKCMADGALGSHGAWLLQPYADLPGKSGLAVQPLDRIRETALLALEHDFQLCTHAIGDRANREVLDLYQEMFRGHPEKKDLRWRIEHAQILHPADIPRFGELGVIASMQANHATSDAPFVVLRLGEERARRGAYAWRSLLDAGAKVINGTDVPVEPLSPVLNFHAAVTRQIPDGSRFFPEQRMTRTAALRSMTIDAAWAAFEEKSKGSLEAGKLADVVVLSRNILAVPDDEVPQAEVLTTIVGGKVAYER